MTTRQFSLLCFCQLAAYMVGGTLVTLMPIFALRLGADEIAIGNMLALVFVGVAVGAAVAGRLSDRFQQRRLTIIIGGLFYAGSVFLLGQATSMGQVLITFTLAAFFSGITATTVMIMVGLFADERRRGRTFGLLVSMIALGQAIGGVVSGPIVERWGYSGLALAGALAAAAIALAALFLADKRVPKSSVSVSSEGKFWKNRSYLLLLLAAAAASVVSSVPNVARPLLMDHLHFDATAIASTLTVGSLISLPLPLIMGWLSDRSGRRALLILCYLANTVGLFLLISATDLGQFWLATAVGSLLLGAGSLGPALVTDLVPKESLGGALATYSSVTWIGLVIGSAGIGVVSHTLSMTGALMIAVVIGLVSAALVLPINRRARTEVAIAVEGAS